MKALALLIACLGARGAAESELVYTAGRGPNAVTHRIAFKGEHPVAGHRMAYDGIPSPIAKLPLWLPPELRQIGAVVHDDGEGFKHDKGREVYVLQTKEKWKGFDALWLSCAYQGMQEQDHWIVGARYDAASGVLLTAEIRTRFGRGTRATFEIELTSATDPALTKKLG